MAPVLFLTLQFVPEFPEIEDLLLKMLVDPYWLLVLVELHKIVASLLELPVFDDLLQDLLISTVFEKSREILVGQLAVLLYLVYLVF